LLIPRPDSIEAQPQVDGKGEPAKLPGGLGLGISGSEKIPQSGELNDVLSGQDSTH
jgi:hypothetical protein